MNLIDEVNRVYAVTDRNPNTQVYKNKVVNWLNDYYLKLCEMNRWSFLLTRIALTVYPDYTTGTCDVTNDDRAVVGNGTAWTDAMDGHHFIGPDGVTYTIAHVTSTTALTLTAKYRGATLSTQSYTVRFFGYCMPADCIEPASVVSRNDDRGRIRYIDNESEATYYLDRDHTGDPRVYASAGYHQTMTLDSEFTAAAGTAGGSLVEGVTYYYRITVTYCGIEGPPSKEVSFEATSTGRIELSGIDSLKLGTVYAGYVRKVYRKKGPTGSYYYVDEIPADDTEFIDSGLDTPSYPECYFDQPLQEFGRTLKVWFYPRPDVQKDLEIWYYKRPHRLMKDQDVPIIPQAFHDLLWRGAAIDVMVSHNQPTTTLERHQQEQLDFMRRRYLGQSDQIWRMGNGWEGDLFNLQSLRLGAATLS